MLIGVDPNSLTPGIVHALPSHVQSTVAAAYNDALIPLFMLVVPLMIVAGILMAMLHETPLAESLQEQGSK